MYMCAVCGAQTMLVVSGIPICSKCEKPHCETNGSHGALQTRGGMNVLDCWEHMSIPSATSTEKTQAFPLHSARPPLGWTGGTMGGAAGSGAPGNGRVYDRCLGSAEAPGAQP